VNRTSQASPPSTRAWGREPRVTLRRRRPRTGAPLACQVLRSCQLSAVSFQPKTKISLDAECQVGRRLPSFFARGGGAAGPGFPGPYGGWEGGLGGGQGLSSLALPPKSSFPPYFPSSSARIFRRRALRRMKPVASACLKSPPASKVTREGWYRDLGAFRPTSVTLPL
jgi:hypothetical protein